MEIVSPLAQALLDYRPVDAAERCDVERLLKLARSTTPFARSRALHVTGSAIIVDPPRAKVLLRFHPRHDRWLQVGGHGDPSESDPFAVALREAAEETGLGDLASFPDAGRPNLLQVAVVDVGASASEPAHEHGDLRYLLATQHPEHAVAESADAPLRWVTIDEALGEPLDAGLRRGIARVQPFLYRAPAPTDRSN